MKRGGWSCSKWRAAFGFRSRRPWRNRCPAYGRSGPQSIRAPCWRDAGPVAYRQPITRGEIEQIRGVAVNPNIIKTLLDAAGSVSSATATCRESRNAGHHAGISRLFQPAKTGRSADAGAAEGTGGPWGAAGPAGADPQAAEGAAAEGAMADDLGALTNLSAAKADSDETPDSLDAGSDDEEDQESGPRRCAPKVWSPAAFTTTRISAGSAATRRIAATTPGIAAAARRIAAGAQGIIAAKSRVPANACKNCCRRPASARGARWSAGSARAGSRSMMKCPPWAPSSRRATGSLWTAGRSGCMHRPPRMRGSCCSIVRRARRSI